MKKYKNVFRTFIILVVSFIFVYCVINIGSYLMDGYRNSKLVDSLQAQISAFLKPKGKTEEQLSSTKMTDKNVYGYLLSVNKDAAGWLNIPNTDIDYPVVRGQDNEYYLTHNFEEQESSHGSIFMDYENTGNATDSHIVIYGHNMKDGSMFGHLNQFRSVAYCKDHPIINLNIHGIATQWKIFSVFVTDNLAIPIYFNSQQDFARYIQMLESKSLYNTSISAATGSQILTLSTCAYDFKNARFVVNAKRIDNSK